MGLARIQKYLNTFLTFQQKKLNLFYAPDPVGSHRDTPIMQLSRNNAAHIHLLQRGLKLIVQRKMENKAFDGYLSVPSIQFPQYLPLPSRSLQTDLQSMLLPREKRIRNEKFMTTNLWSIRIPFKRLPADFHYDDKNIF